MAIGGGGVGELPSGHTEEELLGADLGVPHLLGLLLPRHQHPDRLVREPLERPRAPGGGADGGKCVSETRVSPALYFLEMNGGGE